MFLCLMLFVSGVCILNAMANGGLEIPDHLKEHAQLLHRTCQVESNVSEDLIYQSRDGFLPSDRSLQCYIHCLFDKAGLVDAQGGLHLEYIRELLPTELQEVLDAVTSKCGTVHGQDACETAWLTIKCYFEADPDHSMLI